MSIKTKKCVPVYIRWMIRRDMKEVMDIENGSFGDDSWVEEEFLRHLKQRNCIGMVCEDQSHCTDAGYFSVVGFMVFLLHKTKLSLECIAVHPDYRACTIGRQMVDKLIAKLSDSRRTHITLILPETNLDAQLFFKSVGFRATDLLREHFDSGEDGYLMEYRLGGAEDQSFEPRNRVAKHLKHQ